MTYNGSAKKSTVKYVKEKQHRIEVKYKVEDYEQIILPAIEKSGLPVATFFKQAVMEKIKRDSEMCN